MALSQLRQGIPDFRARNTELVEVGPNTSASAARAFRQYLGGRDLDFPYLCDPDWAVHHRYGLRQLNVPDALRNHAAMTMTMLAARPFVTPAVTDVRRLVTHQIQQGLYVVDEAGIVRYAHVTLPFEQLPATGELLAVLDHLDHLAAMNARSPVAPAE